MEPISRSPDFWSFHSILRSKDNPFDSILRFTDTHVDIEDVGLQTHTLLIINLCAFVVETSIGREENMSS